MPRRQPKRGRLWLNDGSCIRLRPLHENHVWSYDFVNTRTHDGQPLKLLTVLDESTRQCMAIKGLSHLDSVFAAGVVVVWEDDDVRVPQYVSRGPRIRRASPRAKPESTRASGSDRDA